jgi:hypothetical protein
LIFLADKPKITDGASAFLSAGTILKLCHADGVYKCGNRRLFSVYRGSPAKSYEKDIESPFFGIAPFVDSDALANDGSCLR